MRSRHRASTASWSCSTTRSWASPRSRDDEFLHFGSRPHALGIGLARAAHDAVVERMRSGGVQQAWLSESSRETHEDAGSTRASAGARPGSARAARPRRTPSSSATNAPCESPLDGVRARGWRTASDQTCSTSRSRSWLEPLEEPLAAAQHDRCGRDRELVDDTGREAWRIRSAPPPSATSPSPAASRALRQGGVEAVDEHEAGARVGLVLGAVGEHDQRAGERVGAAPGAGRLVHVPADDPGADALGQRRRSTPGRPRPCRRCRGRRRRTSTGRP